MSTEASLSLNIPTTGPWMDICRCLIQLIVTCICICIFLLCQLWSWIFVFCTCLCSYLTVSFHNQINLLVHVQLYLIPIVQWRPNQIENWFENWIENWIEKWIENSIELNWTGIWSWWFCIDKFWSSKLKHLPSIQEVQHLLLEPKINLKTTFGDISWDNKAIRRQRQKNRKFRTYNTSLIVNAWI